MQNREKAEALFTACASETAVGGEVPRRDADQELKTKLLGGLRSEVAEMTQEDWTELRRRIFIRQAAKMAAQPST